MVVNVDHPLKHDTHFLDLVYMAKKISIKRRKVKDPLRRSRRNNCIKTRRAVLAKIYGNKSYITDWICMIDRSVLSETVRQ